MCFFCLDRTLYFQWFIFKSNKKGKIYLVWLPFCAVLVLGRGFRFVPEGKIRILSHGPAVVLKRTSLCRRGDHQWWTWRTNVPVLHPQAVGDSSQDNCIQSEKMHNSAKFYARKPLIEEDHGHVAREALTSHIPLKYEFHKKGDGWTEGKGDSVDGLLVQPLNL